MIYFVGFKYTLLSGLRRQHTKQVSSCSERLIMFRGLYINGQAAIFYADVQMCLVHRYQMPKGHDETLCWDDNRLIVLYIPYSKPIGGSINVGCKPLL